MSRSTAILEQIASRVIGQPLLIQPQKLSVIAHVLAGRLGLEIDQPELGLDTVERPAPLTSRFVGQTRDAASGARLPYQRTDTGAALITITGSLVNRGAWIGASSGLTSYEGIAAQIRAAMADSKVKELFLDLNTPGGEATGAFELADLVRAANATKPVTAFVNGLAASAGYLIASGAGRIVSVPSGLAGSIGVVMMHADYSEALQKAGIKPTFVFSGDHKVDGNPYEPLAKDVKERLQAEVDTMREEFVQAVAQGRGNRLSAKAARDTEAALYTAKEAKEIGLVDDLASFDAVFDEMNRTAGSTGRSPARRASMNFTQADLDAAQAEGHKAGLEAGKAEGNAAGLKAGAEAERARIKGIVQHAEAEGRTGLAAHYAYDTSASIDEAGAALKAAPKTGSLAVRVTSEGAPMHVAEDVKDRKATTISPASIYASRAAAAKA